MNTVIYVLYPYNPLMAGAKPTVIFAQYADDAIDGAVYHLINEGWDIISCSSRITDDEASSTLFEVSRDKRNEVFILRDAFSLDLNGVVQ